jgi:alkanesulfonate monooxygenase SsuD/methylene tetrahydromethanopterin reductase-like flavin-dependent oxidoreductase (luciferase family)
MEMTKLEPKLSTAVTSFAAEDPGDWGHLLRQVEALDRAGFDRVVLSDHVVFGENLDEYSRPEVGGQAGGKQPTGPDGHWLEPLTTLSVFSGRTRQIRLGTNILIAALRRPVVLAKSAATLDETLRICQELWRNTPARYESKRLRFDRIHMMPKPVQAGGVPIWVSGTVNPRSARRLAEFGSGWIPWGDAAADLSKGIPAMRAALAEAGGDLDGIEVVGGLRKRNQDGKLDISATMAQVPDLISLGVTDFRIQLAIPDSPGEAEDLLAPIVGAFREAAGRAP